MRVRRYERGLRRYCNKQPCGSNITELSVKECTALVHYLDCLCESEADELSDDDFLWTSAKLFWELTDAFNRQKQLDEYLQKLISDYVSARRLKPLKQKAKKLSLTSDDETEDEEDICFFTSDIPYSFAEDKRVERDVDRDFIISKITDTYINFIRCVSLDKFDFLKDAIKELLIGRKSAAVRAAAHDITDVQFLIDEIGFSKQEALYILVMSRIHGISTLHSVWRNIRSQNESRCIAAILGISVRQLSHMLRPDQKIRSFGFLDEDGDFENDVIECVRNQSLDIIFADVLSQLDCTNAYDIDSFNIPENQQDIMSHLLESPEPVSLLFYGKPGSGKTEYAKALIKKSGLNSLIFKNETELTEEKRRSPLARLNCLLALNRPDTVLVVDEADSLLQTTDMMSFFGSSPSKSKGIVNKMLENNRNKIIWIVNFTSQIDDSTRRRFTFSRQFDAMSSSQLRSIAERKLAPLQLPETTTSSLLRMFERYDVTGASVDNVVKTLKSLRTMDEEKLLISSETILKENALLVNGRSKLREHVNSAYDEQVLNTSMPAEQIITMIRNARAYSEKHKAAENGIRMLFYGVSGTGKTEFARYIGEQIGKKILLKRASDILGKYVGETEENIRNAFMEAERKNMILLLDEADSFFRNRDNANNSWEITQVNELLTQMEEFSGILICTTNLKKIMDPAMNRRFHMIVEFKPLDESGIRTLLKRYFDGFTFSESQVQELVRFGNITPGDFGVLSGRIRFMAEDDLSSEYIIKELKKIQDDKNDGESHRIGF